MEHFIADDGEKIHLKISGDGPPLVLLHGWTSSHRDWTPFVEPLGARRRVFRWDARAHGGHTPRTKTVPTVERMARDLAGMLDHWKLDDAVIVGHSMGALTLWQYLRDFGTERLSRVVFVDQSPRLVTDESWRDGIYGDFDHARNADFIRELEQDFAEALLRLVAFGLNDRARAKYLEDPGSLEKARQWLRRLPPEPLIACWQSLTAADYRDVLATIDIPALLIYGGESNFYLPRTAAYVRDTIPDALLRVYPDTDHAPHLWQQERFVADLLAFIDGEAAAASGKTS